MVIVALEAAAAAAERGHRRRGASTCDRWCRSTSAPSPSRSAAPAGRSSSRRPRSPPGSRPRWWRPIQEGAFLSLQAPISRVSGWDVPYPMPLVEDHYVPSVERVVAAIRRTAEYLSVKPRVPPGRHRRGSDRGGDRVVARRRRRPRRRGSAGRRDRDGQGGRRDAGPGHRHGRRPRRRRRRR